MSPFKDAAGDKTSTTGEPSPPTRVRRLSLSLRARLIVLGAGASLALVALAVVSAMLMSSIGSQTTSATAKQQQAQLLSNAYNSWTQNDDQNNMYVALLALRQASQQKLAETTWAQGVAASQAAYADLNQLRSLITDPSQLAQLKDINASLAGYNRFSQQVRKAALAGDVSQAVTIQAVGNTAVSNTLASGFTNLRSALQRQAAQSASSVQSSASTGTWVVIIIGLVALPLLLLLVITTIRSIMTGVEHVKQRVDSLAHAMEQQLKTGLLALANGDLTTHLSAQTKPEEIQRTDELGAIMRQTELMRAAILDCYEAYNQSTEKLRDLIGQVTRTAASVGDNSGEMASTSDETGRATAEIAQAIEHVAQGAERQVQIIATARRAAEEVVAAVTESAEHAAQTAEVAGHARETAQQGVAAAEQVDVAMQSVSDSSEAVTKAIRELAAKSEQIGAIVQTITGIAEQTNLLALNAAIEAARAGEQGRGFAVVAEEVRKLAEESQHAAHEISGLIGAIQSETAAVVDVVEDGAQKTADGASVVEQARDAFVSIGQAVEDMNARVQQIAAATQQITAATNTMQESIGEAAAVAEESSASTEQVSASTEETSASTEQVAASAAEMAGNAQTLRALVGNFQLDIGGTGSQHEVFAAALEAHEAWNARLRKAIAAGESSMSIEQAGRDDGCTFGKWLHAPGTFKTEHPQEWQNMHDLHEQFHQYAARVLDCAVSGRAEEATRLLEAPEFVAIETDLRAALTLTRA